ncbi:MAG: 4Fe-4S binding protein [Magnetococcales bacterium]|nr:4Fe-4S binding protein [Magnetococcales bacterium]
MILPLTNKTIKAISPEMTVLAQPSRCVRQRCSHNVCTKCMDICPTDAVFWDEMGIGINQDSCTQCLACLAVCPTAALISPEISLVQLLSELAKHPLPVLGCHGKQNTKAHARLPCLGLLAHSELMVICALIFSEGLQLNLSACEDCPNKHIIPTIDKTHSFINTFITDNALQLIKKEIDLDFQAPSINRRQLFSMLREHTTRKTATIIGRLQDSSEQQSYGEKQVPIIRTMLLKILSSHPEEYRQTIINQLFGNIAFTSECTQSERCVGVCPTGAIQSSGNDNAPSSFNRELCVACNSCQAFCRSGGVLCLQT